MSGSVLDTLPRSDGATRNFGKAFGPNHSNDFARASLPEHRMIVTEQNSGRLMLGAAALSLIVLITVAGLSVWISNQYRDYGGWVRHTYQVQSETFAFRAATEEAETSAFAFLQLRTAAIRDQFQRSASAQASVLDRLRFLTSDNPRQQRRIALLRAYTSRLQRELSSSIAAIDREQTADVIRARQNSLTYLSEIHSITDAMLNEESNLLRQRENDQYTTGQRLNFAVLVSVAALIALCIAGYFIIRRYTLDLSASRNELRQLNEGLEDVVSARTGDLRRANDEIQQFAYVVSHDLRSPLVNIMGFTTELSTGLAIIEEELVQLERDPAAGVSQRLQSTIKADLPESIGFIRSSTQKMDRLINAILHFSRQGKRVLTPEPLNIEAILCGIADSVQYRLQESGAEIVIRSPLPNITSDRLLIEQVFGNLVDNALKFLSPDRPGRIEIRGLKELGRVIYEIEDNGRGVASDDLERIFDLFRRAGSLDQPGEGIGLAHVRAMLHRAGGMITCRSTLGEGTTFRISLPPITPRDEGR
ncbi:MAG TPA: ATP-binding protein [Rhizomicrobium sp.]|nr:ATP-binding protein [Rhizomicrobium sp.]